jgi:hypothetical protein
MAGELIFSASVESFLHLPPVEGYGFVVRKGDKILLTTHLYNPTEKNIRRASGIVEFEYIPKNSGRELGELLAIKLDVVCDVCIDPTFFVEPDSELVLDAVKKAKLETDAELIIGGAHLHPGGQKIELFLNGKLIHTFLPKYSNGTIESVDRFVNYSFRKGDVIDAKAYYKNETDERIDGMAIVLLYATVKN